MKFISMRLIKADGGWRVWWPCHVAVTAVAYSEGACALAFFSFCAFNPPPRLRGAHRTHTQHAGRSYFNIYIKCADQASGGLLSRNAGFDLRMCAAILIFCFILQRNQPHLIKYKTRVFCAEQCFRSVSVAFCIMEIYCVQVDILWLWDENISICCILCVRRADDEAFVGCCSLRRRVSPWI